MTGPRNNDDPHDPLSGYRPDMDQHAYEDYGYGPLWWVVPAVVFGIAAAFIVMMALMLASYIW